jgi:5-methylcytosine-specific restriction endonuclease McrA
VKRLPKPVEQADDVFDLCISKVRRAALKQHLSAAKRTVAASARTYDVAATAAQLHTFPRLPNVNGVSIEEMEAVYTSRMARKGAPGRAIYNKLLATPPFGRCPLCNQRSVSTLDHHLPKTLYPDLVVTPTNLVPSCQDCNKAKLQEFPATATEQTLHPYYDDISNFRWLRAAISPTLPASFVFTVEPAPTWSAELADRVEHHFKTLKLASLYASHAGEELVNIRYGLNTIFQSSGATAVQSHLEGEALSRREAALNSWQTATYSAMAADNWFYSGGFGNC